MTATTTTATQEMEIRGEEDIVEARNLVRTVAAEMGFDIFANAAITTAASELARNTWLHGGGGRMVMTTLRSGSDTGLCLRFIDHGPGIADVDRAMHTRHSRAGSMGLGLSGSARLVDDLHIKTAPGKGTTVEIVKWKRTF